MAARVEIGEPQDSGVARSSRAGTKRKVKARPTKRGCPGRMGTVPRIQTLRRPFFSRTVVKVAVVTFCKVATMAGSSAMFGVLIVCLLERLIDAVQCRTCPENLHKQKSLAHVSEAFCLKGLGWLTGLEPATTGITILDSTN